MEKSNDNKLKDKMKIVQREGSSSPLGINQQIKKLEDRILQLEQQLKVKT